MKSFEGQFQFQVDAKYLGFQWTGEYITVEYSALVNNSKVERVVIMNTSAAPHVFGSIAIHGSWMPMFREMEAAAKDHAMKELSGMNSNVHPTIMRAIAPFI